MVAAPAADARSLDFFGVRNLVFPEEGQCIVVLLYGYIEVVHRNAHHRTAGKHLDRLCAVLKTAGRFKKLSTADPDPGDKVLRFPHHIAGDGHSP